MTDQRYKDTAASGFVVMDKRYKDTAGSGFVVTDHRYKDTAGSGFVVTSRAEYDVRRTTTYVRTVRIQSISVVCTSVEPTYVYYSPTMMRIETRHLQLVQSNHDDAATVSYLNRCGCA